MLLRILTAFAVLVTLACITGGAVCMFVNHDTSQACYMTFGIGISLLILIISISLFFLIIEICSSSFQQSHSGRTLPLSSLPTVKSIR